MDKLILIDGNSIANRAFYALPLLNNSKGMHTNAVYGVTTMLLRLIEEEKPTHFLVAFDAGKITFRHKDYKEYKGGRAKTPPELSEQFPLMKELLQAFKIDQFELEGYEADDIIGTVSKLAEENNKQVLIVTGDKDLLQLASSNVTIALTRKGISEVDRFDPEKIKEKYNLIPNQIIDMKGLMGDASDNIPGVPGVGEKTALKLLHQYGSVEEVLAHSDELKGKMKEKIQTNADQATMSKELATIFREVPVKKSLEQLKFDGFDQKAVSEMFEKLEFKSLLEKMDGSVQLDNEVVQEEINVKVVEHNNLAEVLDKLPSMKSIHFEIIGDNPHQAEILGLSLFTDEESYYIPFDILKSDEARGLREWLADEKQEKWMYDYHKTKVALYWQDIELHGVTFDIYLTAYLLDPTETKNHTISGLAQRYGLSGLKNDENFYGKGAKFKVPEMDSLSEFLCRKVSLIHKLTPLIEANLEENELVDLFYKIELPVAQVLAGMEIQGVKIDINGLKLHGEEIQLKLDDIMKTIYELAGTEFNINSPKQLGEVLFDKLQLPVIKKTKTGYSTDAEVLEKLANEHEVVSKILEYRQLAKLQSTYIEGLLKEVHQDTQKVHTYFRQTIAATGRLSSQFPNLQNIPIRLEEGRKIRKVFVPSSENSYILGADYSQIELRILAHISDDEKLIEAFQNNMDIHTKTAMDVFGVSKDEVDAEKRRTAKAVNFGIVYGISDYGLSQNLNITRKQAKQFIDQYKSVYSGVDQFMDNIKKQAKQNGYVTTLLHRRRYLPEINSRNFNLRSFAERTALNTPIQGSNADIIKLAMIQIEERIQAESLKSKMLLQVHDELVFEVPEDELDIMKQIVPEIMESVIDLKIPLKVDVSYGRNWFEAK
ncbi:DNA polymerase I [Chengkuizengella axinellae]|uniref:DNA polymerase I n=1 Tax=Chengkuizengella axinellae TaxID=3064388 RepID=A0ABT9IYQ2_9BACL|nr:DNA polymerase I [Chengkuizengella sp. 2205SS18-9]MDP5274445.1 DNA polymerase I [Chengkuizengella sp. 2205SS18-9]